MRPLQRLALLLLSAIALAMPSLAAGQTWTNANPGIGGRDMAADGHFVNFTATMVTVPEPSALILSALGGAILAWALRSRRATAHNVYC
jgi:hypothetical protein